MLEVKPGMPESVIPITQEMRVETERGEGFAIAMNWTSNEMLYLVVSAEELERPRWISEMDLYGAYIGDRPSGRSTPRSD